jgi:hypothetical protein
VNVSRIVRSRHLPAVQGEIKHRVTYIREPVCLICCTHQLAVNVLAQYIVESLCDMAVAPKRAMLQCSQAWNWEVTGQVLYYIAEINIQCIVAHKQSIWYTVKQGWQTTYTTGFKPLRLSFSLVALILYPGKEKLETQCEDLSIAAKKDAFVRQSTLEVICVTA